MDKIYLVAFMERHYNIHYVQDIFFKYHIP